MNVVILFEYYIDTWYFLNPCVAEIVNLCVLKSENKMWLERRVVSIYTQKKDNKRPTKEIDCFELQPYSFILLSKAIYCRENLLGEIIMATIDFAKIEHFNTRLLATLHRLATNGE